MNVEYFPYESPFGQIWISTVSDEKKKDGKHICCIELNGNETKILNLLRNRLGITPRPCAENKISYAFGRYFAGHPDTLANLEERILWGTPFQRLVWQTLKKIPHGQTRSYSWLAAEIGSPPASRAVGSANAANPIPIVLPCHRIIKADGSLGGYSSGLETKRFLLKLEGEIQYLQKNRDINLHDSIKHYTKK